VDDFAGWRSSIIESAGEPDFVVGPAVETTCGEQGVSIRIAAVPRLEGIGEHLVRYLAAR
jgi:hypothetical protein